MKMHVFFQLAVVLFALFAGLTAISIAQKRLRFKSGLVFFLVLCMSVGFAYLGFKTQGEDEKAPLVKAGTILSAGNYQKALEVLNSTRNSNSEDPLHNLYKARLNYLNSNKRVAAYYYALVENALNEGKRISIVDKDALETELEAFHKEYMPETTNNGQAAFQQYLQNAGLNPGDYGVETASLTSSDTNQSADSESQTEGQSLENTISSEIQDEVESMTSKNPVLSRLADKTELLAEIQDMVESGSQSTVRTLPNGEQKEIKLADLADEALSLYNKNKSDQELNQALVEAFVLTSDYDEAKEILMDIPAADNLAVLSELVMAGKIEGSDLKDLVDYLPEEAYDKLLTQYENLYDRMNDQDKVQEAQLVKDKLEAVEAESKNPELTGLMETIDKKISSDKNQTQLNLQLAKISVFLSDEQKADEYIEKAVQNIDSIKNEAVVEGLGALSNLQIQESGSFEELKDIPEKVKTLSDEILPVRLPPEAKVQNTAFEDHTAGYFTRKAVEVNITKIDTSAYPEVRAYVQFGFDTGEDLKSEVTKKDLKLQDTGNALAQYQLDKIKVDKSNIILCVDISPSMENFMGDLKTACIKFIATMGKNEKVGIIGFDAGIISDFPFDNQKTSLEANINSLNTGNGTNIHNAVVQSLSKFSQQEGENNIVIVLSDGANNNAVSQEEMDYVAEQALKTGATIYTIGLGENVDGNYLSALAQKGNGKFIYAPSSNQLEAFYSFLHNQIRNQYKITYQAPQQELFDRYLEVELPKQQAKGLKNYSLVSNKELTPEEQAALIELMDKTGGVYAKGLDKRSIVKAANAQEEVNLIGGGFSTLKASDIEINLEGYGPLKQDRIHITDNERIKLSLPQNIPVGTYTLKVNLRGRTFTFKDELQILKSGDVKTIEFGPYKISANEIRSQGGNKYVLKGNVQINDFLRFKGDLIVEGDYKKEHYLNLTPQSESYIAFRKGKAPNFLVDEVFLRFNLNLNLKQWDRFSINRDGSPVDINLPTMVDMGLLYVPAPKITFNPDNLEFMTYKLNLNLPMQKYLFLAAGAKPINFEGEFKMLITAEQIAYAGSFSLETDGSLLGKRMLNILELKKLKGSADTMKGDFTFEVGVGLTFWRSEANELGLKLGWKSCKFDELQMRLPFEWKILQLPQSPVPVTIKEITGGVSNLSLSATDGWDKLSKLKYMLQSDIVVAKASDVLPFLDSVKWLKDKIPGLLLIDDAKLTATFEKLAFTFDAKLKLFEEFDIGAIELALGNYEFKNSLLNMGPQDAIGLHIKNTRGINLDFDKLKLTLQNAVGIDANNKGMFLQATGVASASVNLWKFERKCSFDGDALIAVHKSDAGMQFTIGLRGRDIENGKATDFRFFVNGDKIAVEGIDIPFTEKDTIEISL